MSWRVSGYYDFCSCIITLSLKVLTPTSYSQKYNYWSQDQQRQNKKSITPLRSDAFLI